MNNSKYRFTLYVIIVVIIATISIQVYWNYKNYLSNKQQFISDVQLVLDQAVDNYYTNIAHETTLGLKVGNTNENIFEDNGILDRISKSIDDNNSTFKGIDSLRIEQVEGITILRGVAADSFFKDKTNTPKASWKSNDVTKVFDSIQIKQDSTNRSDFEMLTSKVIISISNDTLNLNTIDSLVLKGLKTKDISTDFQLDYHHPKSKSFIEKEHIVSYDKANDGSGLELQVTSTSTFLPAGSTLNMEFQNKTWLIFQRSLGGILISTLLVLAVISCLIYLLNIIKRQKQLSEVKNDLISNITHEFKTPIATIGVALESLQNFNAIDDKDKTKNYLDMSSAQLSKLNIMVEKLLETATLDSESLELNKERYDISEVVTSIVEKHNLQNEKTVQLDIEDHVFATVDVFHFENAINNIVDNAFKYGGDIIDVKLHAQPNQIEIEIADNGTSLTKANKERIFEKFYRIPKGNTHDVKGFGIGLYYTKKIIEKHNGTIILELGKTKTNFKINMPYA